MKESIWKLQAFAFALSGLIVFVPSVSSSAGAFLPIESKPRQAERFGAEAWRIASSQSDQVEVKIIVTDRRRRGDLMTPVSGSSFPPYRKERNILNVSG